MSFKEAYSAVGLCNRALSIVPEAPITDIDQNNHTARVCKMHYKPTIRFLLEANDWGLARKRAPLAESASNNHPGYLYCYEEPADLAFLVSVGYPVDSHGQAFGVAASVHRFERVEGVIYSNVPNAVAVYTSLDITEDQFNEQFAAVAELYLAAKFIMPISKKADWAKSVAADAKTMLNQAIANYRNQIGYTYGDTQTQTDAVRQNGTAISGGGVSAVAADYPAYGGFNGQ